MRTHVSSITIGRFPRFAERRFDIPYASVTAKGLERGASCSAWIAGRDDSSDDRATLEDGYLLSDANTIDEGRQALPEICEVDVRCDRHGSSPEKVHGWRACVKDDRIPDPRGGPASHVTVPASRLPAKGDRLLSRGNFIHEG
jgi:hypothetical protein